ncbi:MAG: Cobyrinic acid A,C-diamide synthase [Candidatus Syntrophoarchaeum caldarius]|uniref:Cobyrinate a,c-diamide synthase n=1 Tax=Candidatus Syntropharchaeum caldarium TaxID=1838285 RepID=A0A1F2PAI4_9EURY|nr:MAG: Cobyrinic acid A,C-diamide synthase [Candidatus Syntrophoarchaeum caldarius]
MLKTEEKLNKTQYDFVLRDMRARIVIGGVQSGVGKTTITLGIIAALRKMGYDVRPFKVGPDFIDPSHQSVIAGNPSHNLDSFMMTPEQIRSSFLKNTSDESIAVIEGVMGFFDGMSGKNEERGSTAHVSKILKAPAILVAGVGPIARSIGAVALGYRDFDPDVNLQGIIFNPVGSEKYKKILEDGIDGILPCLGHFPKDEHLMIKERHLGLKMAHETTYDFDHLAEVTLENIDLDRLVKIAEDAGEIEGEITEFDPIFKGCRVAVARDEAFCFYYPENIEIMQELGVEVVEFSPLRDSLPDVDGIYFGGGYPELYAEELEQNEGIREEIKRRVEEGMPLYAECGGMMYTLRKVNGYEMLGIFDADAELTERLQAVGYVIAESLSDTVVSRKGEVLKGHEFHYSVVHPGDVRFAYRMIRGKGIVDGMDGMVYKNVLASYTHIHAVSHPEAFVNFLSLCHENPK